MAYIVIHALVVILIGYVIYRIKNRRLPLQFIDKHVLITGGSSGIGECMAYIFSALGAFVTIASNMPEEVGFWLARGFFVRGHASLIPPIARKCEIEVQVSGQGLYAVY